MHSKPFSLSFGPPSSLSPTHPPHKHPRNSSRSAGICPGNKKRNAGVGERRSWSGRVMAPKRRRRVDGMAGGAESTSSAKRAKLRKKKKRDALERKKNDLFLRIEKAKELVREAEEYLAKHMPSVCDDLEDENRDELMDQLPAELWEKIVDEYVQQNDLPALAMTCRFFRDTTKDLGKKMETNFRPPHRLLELRENRNVTWHTFGWYCWVCDTMEVMPGFKYYDLRRRRGSDDLKAPLISDGAVYEGDLVNYALVQGSVEILRYLMEEKGCELNQRERRVDELAGKVGSIEILEYLRERGYKFRGEACTCAASGGHLEALKWLRGLDPPCYWSRYTTDRAASEGHLEVLKWLRDQDPPCPWEKTQCKDLASDNGHQHIVEWIDQREDESDVEYDGFSYDSNGVIRYW